MINWNHAVNGNSVHQLTYHVWRSLTNLYLASVLEKLLIGQPLEHGGINTPVSYVGTLPRYKPIHANLHFSYINVAYSLSPASNSVESIIVKVGLLKFKIDEWCQLKGFVYWEIYLAKISEPLQQVLLGLPLFNLSLVFNHASLKRMCMNRLKSSEHPGTYATYTDIQQPTTVSIWT